ncbi:hypothetical protein KOR34_43400 [Posidoniimonas corsicana]|uniref:Uncharacterized protein n=1 Tax=Posidoniimonas corsicana TaxID=1938618 RepID=A0A5C5UZQ8_9BACT|nr:DUF3466 family protein [Posidoniimonas corsicana]TWT30967.1 hypothetical protein KOR34_43400 [Posidoniimonas corsicana]
MRHIVPTGLAAAVSLIIHLPAADAAPFYHIRDLTPDGYHSSIAYDINASGDAVGVATGAAGEAYFYYDHSTGVSSPFGVGVVSPRGSIVGSGYREAAINDDGLVAGTARFLGGVGESRGFIYNGSTFTNLGVLAGDTATGIRPASDALDINNLGLAVGTATSGAGTITTESDNIDIYAGASSPVVDIDGDYSVATRHDRGRAINDAGLVLGENESGKATLFSGAGETVLMGVTSRAFDLNESGQAVVEDIVANATYRYEPGTTSLTAIPQIGTGLRMFGKAINERGDVVGQGDRHPGLSGQARGFIYSDDDATSYILEDHVIFTGSDTEGLSDWGDLNTAWGVNDSGWIVGQGDRRFDGAAFPNNRAYLLIPFNGLAGDYNEDGVVNAADYTTWRDALGGPAGSLPNDVDGGPIGAAQYATWRDSYGAAGALSLHASAAPEPAAAALLAAALAGLARWRDRTRLNA